MRDDDATQALREAYAVPTDFHIAVDAPTIRVWRGGLEAAVTQVATAPEGMPPADVAGRAPLGRIEAEGGALLVRPYRKGGLLRAVRGARFRGRLRPLDELVLHAALQEAGVPVLQVAGAVVQGDEGGWTGFLLTREEAGAVDLEAWLQGSDPAGGGAADPALTLQRAGAAVRALHDAGVAHADLHPKNLLVTGAGPVLVIDLDRAASGASPLADTPRVANLARFERSLAKHRLKGTVLTRWDAEAFYAGYAGRDGDGTAWAARARARRGSLTLRRLWWRVTGATRPEADA